jgi:glucose/arabinose dehydrogenase
MKNKLSIKITVAIAAAAIAIVSLAGCTSTAITHTAVSKPAASSSKPAPKASAAEVQAKTGIQTTQTADGTFNGCSGWMLPNGTDFLTTYTPAANCDILVVKSAFAAQIGKAITCAPQASTGDSATGIIYSGSTYKCTYTVPVAGK